MAKIQEEIIAIKVSKLVKDSDEMKSLSTDEITLALEQVAQELFGDGVVVEGAARGVSSLTLSDLTPNDVDANIHGHCTVN